MWSVEKPKLAELVRNLPGMAYRCRHDADWTLEWVSEGVTDLLGYTPTQLVDENVISIGDLVHPDDLESVSLAVETALAARGPFRMTYRMRNAEGRYLWVWEQGYGEFSEAGDLLALEGFVSDVTQRVTAERALHEKQRLDALGQLARGVAHDFNNLLSIITASSQLIALGDQAGKHRDDLEAINEAVERANRLTTQLVAFSRPASPKLALVDVNRTLELTMHFLGRVIDDSITVNIELCDEPATAAIPSSELEQILTNLAINARDSMPDGGTLTVRSSRSTRFDDGSRESRPCVVIEVIDTGGGMSSETVAKIFDVFFTTKKSQLGTGLGLSVVQAAVRRHGGDIEVESEVNRGTRFIVRLPWIDTTQRSPVTARSGSVVLVVDDEASIRRGLKRALGTCGHVVLEASSVAQALHLSERHRGTIDLAILDYQLGDGDGVALAAMLAEQRPELRALLISGTYKPNGLASPFLGFIRKPFSADDVLQQVVDALRHREPVNAPRS